MAPPADGAPTAGLIFLGAIVAAATWLCAAPTFRVRAGRPSIARPVRLEARRWCDFEISGESHYQDALLVLAGARRTRAGAQIHCEATLVPDPANPYDPNAVAVMIGGLQVGWLRRQDAPTYNAAVYVGGARGRAPGLAGRGHGAARSSGNANKPA